MMGDHTPGPWRISGISQETGSISIGCNVARIVIADVTNAASIGDFLAGAMRRGGGRFEQSDATTQFANAHLIAAAPDLLCELEGILAFTDGFGCYYTQSPAGDALRQWIEGARQAVAKAKPAPQTAPVGER